MPATGSIRPKANGWEIRVSAGSQPNGRRRRVSRYIVGSRHDAEQELLRLRLALGDGKLAKGGDTTVEDLLVTWLSLSEGELSPTTLDRYRDLARLHLIPALGKTKVRKLEPAGLDRHYRTLLTHLSPTTIRQVHAVLRSALREAERWGWVDRNVARLARAPRMSKHELAPPSPADVVTLIAKARADGDDDLADFIHLAAVAGARRGELCGLHWDDLDGHVLNIRRTVVETQGHRIVKDTKTHQGRRVALDAGTVAMLKARRARRADQCRQTFGFRVKLGPWIFSDDPGGRAEIIPDRMTQRFSRHAKRCGIEACRLHDLRHFAATTAIDAGVSLVTVSKRLGHRDTSTTSNIYAHALEHADQAAADILGAAINGKA